MISTRIDTTPTKALFKNQRVRKAQKPKKDDKRGWHSNRKSPR